MSIRPLLASLHPGWLTAAIAALLAIAMVLHTIHFQVAPCDQRLATDALQKIDAADLASVADGSLVAVRGDLRADGNLDDGLIEAPVAAVVLERLVQKTEVRFGTRVEQGAGLHTRRHVTTVSEKWTLATTADTLPVINGERINTVQIGQFPERIGGAELWSSDQFAATWTPIAPKPEVVAELAAQGYMPDADEPGFYRGNGGLMRIGWRAAMPQSLTWLGAKQTSEFTGKPTITAWSQGSMSVPREVYAGLYDPSSTWRQAEESCVADRNAWPLRLRVNAPMLLPLLFAALLLAAAVTRVRRNASIPRTGLLARSLMFLLLASGLYVLAQIGSLWPFPGWTQALLPLGLASMLVPRTRRADQINGDL